MIPFHPLANIFPLIKGAEFDAIVADMRTNGFRPDEKIAMLDGMVLDGRNRYRAALAARLFTEQDDIVPGSAVFIRHFALFSPERDGDPLDFVIAKNLHRRHLDDGQRQMVAADIASLRPGDNQHSPNGGTSQAAAARRLNVSKRGVERAAVVRDHAVPEISDAAREGDLPVATAEVLASLPLPQQQQIVLTLPRDDDGRLTAEARKQLAPVIKEVRAAKQAEKKVRRQERLEQLTAKILTMPAQMFGLVLEDFEWDHEPYSRDTGMDRHPGNHYPTAADAHTPEEIVARTAARWACAAPDCVGLVWVTIPHLAIALQVVALRGFAYKSHLVWHKLRNGKGRGPGYWVTGEHELLLICTRGKVVAPDTAHFRSLFEAPVGAHSEKPDFQYTFAEFHFPNLPKIELNARRARPGWTAWGLDAPEQNSPDAANEEGGGVAGACSASERGENRTQDGARSIRGGDCPEVAGQRVAPHSSGATPLILKPIGPICCQHFADGRSVDPLDIPAFLRRAS